MIKEMKNFPGYWVSDDGRVFSAWKQISPGGHGNGFRSINTGVPFRRLTPTIVRGGYLRQFLRKDGKYHRCGVHALVLEAFVGPRPAKAVTRHLDGNPANNHISNLSWGTQAENKADELRHGTRRIGEKHPRAKLNQAIVEEIRALPRHSKSGRVKRGSLPRLAKKYNVSRDTIAAVLSGNNWRAE